jgi:putative inorganic carbon (HCO3(-)) transporter
MQPHMLAWGFATSFPFALLIALVTTGAMLATHAARALPMYPPVFVLCGLAAWIALTLPAAGTAALGPWSRFMQAMLMTAVCTMLTTSRRDIERLVVVLAVSLGVYGVVGGVGILHSARGLHLAGPPGSDIVDSNAIALALVMTLPLLHQIQQGAGPRALRRILVLAMALCVLATIGSGSRGAMLAMGALAGYYWWRRARRPRLAAALLCTAPLLMLLVPGQEPDGQVQARLDAWRVATELALGHLPGGGFAQAPAQSIYFQMLGEQGFPGLALYLATGILAWRSASAIVEASADRADLAWASSLATAAQASLAAFAVGGAFVSLAYFDVPYYLVGAIVVTRSLVDCELARIKGVPCSFPYPS